MIKLTTDDIKKITYPLVFERGVSYYKKGAVYNFKVEDDTDFNDNLILDLSCRIRGTGREIYDTYASISESEGIIACECDCIFYSSYGAPCKHIVALLLKYNEQAPNLEKKHSFNDALISNLKNELMSHNHTYTNDKREINFGVNLTIYKYRSSWEYHFNFTIGEEKSYVVKSLAKLFDAILTEGSLPYGKEFKYDYNKHKFNEIDQEIIDYLIKIYKVNKPIEYYARYADSIETFNRKEISLTESQFRDILSLLKEKNFSGTILDNHYSNIDISFDSFPLEFEIEKDENGLSISSKATLPVPLTISGDVLHSNGVIYIPEKNKCNIYKHFYAKLQNNKQILIEEKDFDALGNYIIPALKEISHKVHVSGYVKDKIHSPSLKSKIFLDKLDDSVVAKLIFNYDDIEINPLISLSEKSNKILIRDISSENFIINLLENFNFETSRELFLLKDEDKIIDFLSNGIESIQDHCDIFYSESFKNFKVYTSSKISSSIKINDNDLLEFNFSIDGVDKREFPDILSSLRIKKKYHRLKDGSFLSLNSHEFEEFANTINYLGLKSKDFHKDAILLPKYNSIYLDEKLKSSKNIKIEKNKKFRETVSNIREITESDFKAPEHLETILREYQKIGFKWFSTLSYCGFGGILADEMGLGKTLQAISFISSIKESSHNSPVLVVCPTSLVYNWESEVNKFSPSLSALVVSGHKDSRTDLIKSVNDYDIVITSYPLIRLDIDLYKEVDFLACFLDEAQNIKNPNSLSAKSVKEINSKYRFALTGTPIENNLTELWSIFDFIMPGYLLNHNNFRKLYETPIIKNKDEKALLELNKHINPFILRRHKSEVIKELPPKIEHKYVIDLNDEQKKLYASYVSSFRDEIETEISSQGFNKSKLKILSLLTRLRQICCDPSSFIEDYSGNSSKIDALKEILENSLSENHRILIFSQFTSILKNIKSELEDLNISTFYLDGSTPSEKRIEMVNDFNEGNVQVFLISLKAGGTGLNLTGADTVIHFDPWWNPAVEAQATDRAHRIGQTKTVEVIKLITKGTIEEKINELQEKKKDIFDNVVNNASSDNVLTSMNEEDIKKLFI